MLLNPLDHCIQLSDRRYVSCSVAVFSATLVRPKLLDIGGLRKTNGHLLMLPRHFTLSTCSIRLEPCSESCHR